MVKTGAMVQAGLGHALGQPLAQFGITVPSSIQLYLIYITPNNNNSCLTLHLSLLPSISACPLVRLVCHHQSVRLYLEIAQLSLFIVNHTVGCILFDLPGHRWHKYSCICQPLGYYGVPCISCLLASCNPLLCARLSQGRLCRACSWCGVNTSFYGSCAPMISTFSTLVQNLRGFYAHVSFKKARFFLCL